MINKQIKIFLLNACLYIVSFICLDIPYYNFLFTFIFAQYVAQFAVLLLVLSQNKLKACRSILLTIVFLIIPIIVIIDIVLPPYSHSDLRILANACLISIYFYPSAMIFFENTYKKVGVSALFSFIFAVMTIF